MEEKTVIDLRNDANEFAEMNLNKSKVKQCRTFMIIIKNQNSSFLDKIIF